MSEESREIATRPHQKFAQYVQSRAEIESEMVAKELSQDQMDKILTATTPEELDAAMEMAGLMGLKELPDGTEIQINSWRVAIGNRTEFMNSLGVFAVIYAQDLANGIEYALDTGIERIIAYLRMCEQMDRIPVQVRIVKTPTGSGNETITLLPLRKRAIQGNTE